MAETLNEMLDEFKKDAALVEKTEAQIKQKAARLSDKLNKDKSDNDTIMDKFKQYEKIESKIIKLNVGGTLFSTMRSTLIKKIKDKETGNFHQPNIFEGILSNLDIKLKSL